MFNLVKIVIDPYFLGYHWYYSRSLILLLFTQHTQVCLECVSCTSDASQEFKSHICCVWPAAICRTATERHDRACGDRIQTHWEAWECSSIIISLDLQRVQRLKATGPTEMVQWKCLPWLRDIFISNMMVLSCSGMAEKLHLPSAQRDGPLTV